MHSYRTYFGDFLCKWRVNNRWYLVLVHGFVHCLNWFLLASKNILISFSNTATLLQRYLSSNTFESCRLLIMGLWWYNLLRYSSLRTVSLLMSTHKHTHARTYTHMRFRHDNAIRKLYIIVSIIKDYHVYLVICISAVS